ncbi:hypothetical protein BEWA_006220 [Theileria equi strain WA]|uniref:Uncharacterized protein n=1 Tax=Theileria equi strain WA TaxID=1537102 RepID=L0B122_THEEQ|nr:hypothetical protein BEWA_006220 [Theileria equi strain WA]AFZ81213.1 hypothetical protein BEWA_006220 [Theileria equi strain WA]|eukprot:XP_004830879.1 hypothetical protein BEWA_006220 [Theileria equi strain WA]
MLKNKPHPSVSDSCLKDGKITRENNEPSALHDAFEDAYSTYKSCNFLDASRLLEKVGKNATKLSVTHIASKCYRILGKIHLMQGDALTASQFLSKSDTSLSTLTVLARAAVLEYKSNHNDIALHFAKSLLLYLLESNAINNSKKTIKLHSIFLELLSYSGELLHFDVLLKKFKKDIKYNPLHKRKLLLLAKRIAKTCVFTKDLSNTLNACHKERHEHIIKKIGPINEVHVSQACINFCRELSLNLHRESDIKYTLEIESDTTYETVLCIVKFLVGIDQRGIDPRTSFVQVNVEGSDPLVLNLTKNPCNTDSNTTPSILSHRQGQREIKRRAMNTSEASSVRSHNLKRFWITASYLINLPQSFHIMTSESSNNSSKHSDSHDSESPEFSVYPSDVARFIKYSALHYNLRNAHVILATSNSSCISEKTSRFIMDKKLISLLESKRKWNVLELYLHVLNFLLRHPQLFEKHYPNYAIFVSYLYSTIHKNFCDTFSSNSNYPIIYENNPFKYGKLVGDNDYYEMFSTINFKLGVRLLFILYKGLKLSLSGSFKHDLLFDMETSRGLMRFVFDLCTVNLLQSCAKNIIKTPRPILLRSKIFYISLKMLLLTSKPGNFTDVSYSEKGKSLAFSVKNILELVKNDSNILNYNTFWIKKPLYLFSNKNTHFNHTNYSDRVILRHQNWIKKFYKSLKQSFKHTFFQTGTLETADSIERNMHKKLNTLRKRLFLVLNEFTDLTHIYNIHRYKSPILDWDISRFSWDSVYSIYQNSMSSKEDKSMAMDDKLYFSEVEEILLYATTEISKGERLPKYIGQILFVLCDILSFIAMNLQKTNVQTFTNNDCNSDVAKRFGVTQKSLFTIAISLLYIINNLYECRESIDIAETQFMDDEESPSNSREVIIKDFFGLNAELLNDLHKNFNCFESFSLSKRFSLTFHPLITRILLHSFFIINSELRNLNHLDQGVNGEGHAVSYLLFGIFSQICTAILLSPFNLIFAKDNNGRTKKMGISPLLCIVMNYSDGSGLLNKVINKPTIDIDDLETTGHNLLEQDKLFSFLAILDSFIQIETIYSCSFIKYVDRDLIPESFRKFIQSDLDGNEFTDVHDKLNLGFPLFLFNKLMYLFDIPFIRSFDLELDYLHESVNSTRTINIFNEELISLFSKVAHYRFRIKELDGIKTTTRILIPKGEQDAINEIFQKCFSLVYTKNRDITYSTMSALLSVHLRKNFPIEKPLTYTSVIFLNDRTDKEYISSAKKSFDGSCILFFEDKCSGKIFNFFKTFPDPLILDFNDPSQYHDDRIVLYNKYIDNMNNLLTTQALFDSNNILSTLLTKPSFNFPPSFKGIYMKLIKQYCIIDYAKNYEINDPINLDDVLTQLDTINLASVLMPKSVDIWFCAAIKNFELFLWHSKRYGPTFNDTRSFFPMRNDQSSIIKIIKRTLYLIDITVQTYSYFLSGRNDTSNKLLKNVFIRENIFFGEIDLDSHEFVLRSNRRCKILLFSKCTVLLYLLKIGENIPCRILLDGFSQILGQTGFVFHTCNKGFEKITRNFNSSPNDRVSTFLKNLDSNYKLFYDSEDMETFYLQLKVLERVAKSFYLSKEIYIKLWSRILCGYCDYLAILLRIDYLSHRKNTGDCGPLTSYYSFMHIINSEFMTRFSDGKVQKDILVSFYKLHISRLRLCYLHPEMFYIAFPFRFSNSESESLTVSESELSNSTDFYLLWAKKMQYCCQASNISYNEVINDAFSALLYVTTRCSSDLSYKLYFKLSHYHYRLGNIETSMKFLKETSDKTTFVKQHTTGSVSQDIGYLRNCRKMALFRSRILFDMVYEAIVFSKNHSDKEYTLFSTCLRKLNSMSIDQNSSKAQKNISKPQGTWLFAGFKSITRLDNLVDAIDLSLSSLQKINRKFKQLIQGGDTKSQTFYSLLYVQNVLYNALASSFILLVASCPHFLSLPIVVDIMEPSDVNTIAETELYKEYERVNFNSNEIVESLFSLITEDGHVEDIHGFLKEKNVLHKSSIFVKYGENTATLDMRIVKQLFTLWNVKLFQKPTELSNSIGKSFHSACTKLLYMAPADSIQFKNSKNAALVEGTVVRISDEWISTLRLVSPQKAAAALNEAINKHKDDAKPDQTQI